MKFFLDKEFSFQKKWFNFHYQKKRPIIKTELMNICVLIRVNDNIAHFFWT